MQRRHLAAGVDGANGTLWFPTQDGVAVIDPATIAAPSRPVPPRIESVLMDRAPVPLTRPSASCRARKRSRFNTPDSAW